MQSKLSLNLPTLFHDSDGLPPIALPIKTFCRAKNTNITLSVENSKHRRELLGTELIFKRGDVNG